jgi:Secretion system C-terminal sorting domain
MNHNTRLFLSFDSPNDGANIPVALGYNLNFFGNFAGNQDAKDSYDQELHSVAARQLLIEQKDGLNSSPLFHQIFYSNIRNGGLAGSGGYPINLRKVALLNGSGSSIKTYTEGVQVLKMHGTQKTILDGSVIVFSIEDNFMPITGQSIQIASNLIFRRTPFTIFSGAYPITNNNIRGSMDAVQGSTYDATNAVYVGFEKGLRAQGLGVSLFNLKKLHCFIPTASALGFRNSNFNWNNNIANSNLLCSNQIYFDSYFMPKTNEEHITLTSENVTWLTQEIDKGQQGCPTICTSVIYGRKCLCVGVDNTYYFDFPIPSSSSFIVEPSNNYQLISQTSNSFTIRGSQNGSFAIIKIKIINPCGADVILTKQIMLGYPIPNPELQVNLVSWPNPVCTGRLLHYEFNCTNDWINQNSILQYSWVVPSNWPIQSGGTPYKYVDLYSSNNAQPIIRFQAKNECSVTPTDIFGRVISFKTVGCQYGRLFQISPNPANSEITIAGIENEDNKTAVKNIKEIKILDNLGILKFTRKFNGKNKSEKLFVNNLPIGQYQVSILSDDGLETIPLTILK